MLRKTLKGSLNKSSTMAVTNVVKLDNWPSDPMVSYYYHDVVKLKVAPVRPRRR